MLAWAPAAIGIYGDVATDPGCAGTSLFWGAEPKESAVLIGCRRIGKEIERVPKAAGRPAKIITRAGISAQPRLLLPSCRPSLQRLSDSPFGVIFRQRSAERTLDPADARAIADAAGTASVIAGRLLRKRPLITERP